MSPARPNALYFGDNLTVLRQDVKPESVDLVYLDPPFNSQQDYNVIYREQGKTGKRSETQQHAFHDTWEWGDAAEAAYQDVVRAGGQVGRTVEALYKILGNSDMMAYLCMMAPRLVELHRVLKPTGSLYLHCDPTASHYLKVILDASFGPGNYRNEIIWERTTGRKSGQQFGRVHDVLFFYSKGNENTWNPPTVPQSEDNARGHDLMRDKDGLFRVSDFSGAGPGPARKFGERGLMKPPAGRHWMFDQEGVDRLLAEGRIVFSRGNQPRLKTYLKDLPGVAVRDVWTDIDPINAAADERLNYPTQKPEALLERIIEASSQPGDVVLDPFCGCGTAVAVAQRLKRRWIGIDIAGLALTVIEKRLVHRFGRAVRDTWTLSGVPQEPAALVRLAHENPYAFQDCVLIYLKGRPLMDEERKRGGDMGIDGELVFYEGKQGTETESRRVIVQVKGGEQANPSWVRDLRGVLDRERERGAVIGVLVTATPATDGMKREAASVGRYESPTWGGGPFPRLQVIDAAELLEAVNAGRHPVKYPVGADITWPEALRAREEGGEQIEATV